MHIVMYATNKALCFHLEWEIQIIRVIKYELIYRIEILDLKRSRNVSVKLKNQEKGSF